MDENSLGLLYMPSAEVMHVQEGQNVVGFCPSENDNGVLLCLLSEKCDEEGLKRTRIHVSLSE